MVDFIWTFCRNLKLMATPQFCKQNSEFFCGLKRIYPALVRIRDSYLTIFEFQDTILFTGEDWRGERVSIKNILDIWHIRDGLVSFVISSYISYSWNRILAKHTSLGQTKEWSLHQKPDSTCCGCCYWCCVFVAAYVIVLYFLHYNLFWYFSWGSGSGWPGYRKLFLY